MKLRNAMMLSAMAFGLADAAVQDFKGAYYSAPNEPPRGKAKSGAARAKRDAKKRRNSNKRR